MKDKPLSAVINNKHQIAYINLTEDNKYKGWTSDFRITLNNGEKMFLDLSKEKDLFLLLSLLLFGQDQILGKTQLIFTTYLKSNKFDNPDLWRDKEVVLYETAHCKENVKEKLQSCTGIK